MTELEKLKELRKIMERALNPEPKCTCETEKIEPHRCPFRCEIKEDFESLCTCCRVCEKNCADDI
jgi:hypothetical protein